MFDQLPIRTYSNLPYLGLAFYSEIVLLMPTASDDTLALKHLFEYLLFENSSYTFTSGANVIKLFMSVIYEFLY